MKKQLSSFMALAVVLAVALTSCRKDDNPGKNDNNTGTGQNDNSDNNGGGGGSNPPPTGDPGVVIGGIRWATRNVDAPHTFAATLQDPGMFYQWNSPIGWSATDPMVDSNGSTLWLSSWFGNNASSWQSANDPCPAGWRVPTNVELQALYLAGSGWTTTPAPGRVFGSGSNTIFLTAAGYRHNWNGALDLVDSFGYYWSATAWGDDYSYCLDLGNSSYATSVDEDDRAMGFHVRCVAK